MSWITSPRTSADELGTLAGKNSSTGRRGCWLWFSAAWQACRCRSAGFSAPKVVRTSGSLLRTESGTDNWEVECPWPPWLGRGPPEWHLSGGGFLHPNLVQLCAWQDRLPCSRVVSESPPTTTPPPWLTLLTRGWGSVANHVTLLWEWHVTRRVVPPFRRSSQAVFCEARSQPGDSRGSASSPMIGRRADRRTVAGRPSCALSHAPAVSNLYFLNVVDNKPAHFRWGALHRGW